MTLEQRLQEFIAQYIGAKGTGDTSENKGQCVGLIEVWTDSLGLPHTWGNAKDLLNDADPNYFDIIKNNPQDTTQFPLPGDIMVFDGTWGNGAGHTGVVVSATGTSYTLFEQNNPEGHAPQEINHSNYNGVLGWLHPKTQQANQQSTIDQLRIDRDKNWNLYQTEVKKNDDLTTLTTTLSNIQSKFHTEQEENVRLNEALTSLTGSNKEYGIEVLTAQKATQAVIDDRKTIYNQLGVSSTQEALAAITALQKPHAEVVKEIQPIIEGLAAAAIKKAPPSSLSFWQKFISFFKRG